MAAIDLGAQSGRVALGRFDGERLTLDLVHRFPNIPVHLRGTLYWDALRLYRDILDGLRLAARDSTVNSVAVDAWGVDVALINRAGELIQNPTHYRDGRRAAAVAPVLERVSSRELYERSGIQTQPINTIFELAALAARSDRLLENAETALLMPDLFHYWLAGTRVTERTNATTTQCVDARTGAWATDILDRIDVPSRLLSEIVAAGTNLGRLTGDVASETGLKAANVIAGATHDTAAAVVAAPLPDAHSVYLSVGTWSLVGVELAEPLINEAVRASHLGCEGGAAGVSLLQTNITGLWLLEECRRAWQRDGCDFSYDDLFAEAETAPAFAAFVDPNDPAFVEPGDMPTRIVEYCRRTEQPVPQSRAEIVRCLLESLSLKHAETLSLLERVTGKRLEVLHLVGGGAQNRLLCSWTAAAAGRPVLAGPVEATVVGNLLVQAIAQGLLDSLDQARDVVRRSFAPILYEPRAHDDWAEAHERFRTLRDVSVERGYAPTTR